MTRRTAGLAPVDHVELPIATQTSTGKEPQANGTVMATLKRKYPASNRSSSPAKRFRSDTKSSHMSRQNNPSERAPLHHEITNTIDVNETGNSQRDEERTHDLLREVSKYVRDNEGVIDSLELQANIQPYQEEMVRIKDESNDMQQQNESNCADAQASLESTNVPERPSIEALSDVAESSQRPIIDTPVANHADAVSDPYPETRTDWSQSYFLMDPGGWLRPKVQPMLQQLAANILSIFSEVPLIDLQRVLEDHVNTTHKEAWKNLQATFLQARKIISPFLSYLNEAEPLNMDFGAMQQINLATALSTLVRPEVTMGGLAETHHSFLDIFCRLSGEVKSWQADLLYSIKLHVFKYRTANEPSKRMQILDEIFPKNLEARLRIILKRHASDSLAPPEEELLYRCRKTRESLEDPEVNVEDNKGNWKIIIQNVSLQCKSYVQSMLGGPSPGFASRDYQSRNHLSFLTAPTVPPAMQSPQQHRQLGLYHEDGRYALSMTPQSQPPPSVQPQQQSQPSEQDDEDDYIQRAALAAHAALIGSMSNSAVSAPSFSQFSSRPENDSNENRQSTFVSQQQHQRPSFSQEVANQTAVDDLSQPFSTKEQYERARLAATAKASSKSKGASVTPSQRRPWSSEEEEALMAGLDRVKGPHWSAILAMYGANGTVSEVLKDRNQVQLKDKARNLKLFFLKGGHDVPHYLQHVTGELKTRAPAQAAKNEIREKLVATGTEDKATADAISVLAAGCRSFTAANGAPISRAGSEESEGTSYGRMSPSPVAIAAQYEGQTKHSKVDNREGIQTSVDSPNDKTSQVTKAWQDNETDQTVTLKEQSRDKDDERSDTGFRQAIQLALAASRQNEQQQQRQQEGVATESTEREQQQQQQQVLDLPYTLQVNGSTSQVST